jgi:site-specific recombinase XerD
MTQEIIKVEIEAITNLVMGNEQALPLDQSPAAVYLATLRPTGRRSMHHALRVIADLASGGKQSDPLAFPWASLRYQHTAAIVAALGQLGYRPATINRTLAALRGVLKQAWNLGQMDSESYHRAINFKGARGSTLPRGRGLKPGELKALMDVCSSDQSPAGCRDAAIIAVLYGAGLRRSEVVKLEVTDYDHETGALTVRGGKGNKDRLVYVGGGGEAALRDWLRIRGEEPGALFNPVNKSGKISQKKHKKMADQVVLDMLQKRGKQAGVASFSPHDLRRSFISDLLDGGADIVTVQKLAGHADVSTTARYDRRGEAAKKKAVGILHVPYSSGTLPL